MLYPDDRRIVPPQAADGPRYVRVVDDQIVRKSSGYNQAVVWVVGHVFHALGTTSTSGVGFVLTRCNKLLVGTRLESAVGIWPEGGWLERPWAGGRLLQRVSC